MVSSVKLGRIDDAVADKIDREEHKEQKSHSQNHKKKLLVEQHHA